MPGEAESRLSKHHPVKPTHHPGQGEQGTDHKPGQGECCSPGTKLLPTRNATVGVKLGGIVHWGSCNQHCRSWGDCPVSDHLSSDHSRADGGLERCKPAVGEWFLPVLTVLYHCGKQPRQGIYADAGECCSRWCLRCKVWWEPQGLLQTCCSA